MPVPPPFGWRDTLQMTARLLGEVAQGTELTLICTHAGHCAESGQAVRTLRQKIATCQQCPAGTAARDGSEQAQVGSACRDVGCCLCGLM